MGSGPAGEAEVSTVIRLGIFPDERRQAATGEVARLLRVLGEQAEYHGSDGFSANGGA